MINWTKIGNKVKTFFSVKDVLTFLVFLILATAIWWMHAMHSLREKSIDIPVQYTGIPANVDFTTPLPEIVRITICDAGNRLNYYSNIQKAPIVINLEEQIKGKKGNIIITTEQIRPQLTDHLQGTTKLQQIQPDFFETHYFAQDSKTVPIKLNSDFVAANQYHINSITLSQNHVTIYGDKAILDTIRYVETQKISLHEIKDTVNLQVDLMPISHIRLSNKKAHITIISEQFTEKVFHISITPKNVPTNHSLLLFPAAVEVTTKVALSHFNEVSEHDFKVFVNYPTNKSATTLSVNIQTINPYILDTKCVPSEVEYLIEQHEKNTNG